MEMKLWEIPNASKMFQVSLSVQATSVAPERVFSTAGDIVKATSITINQLLHFTNEIKPFNCLPTASVLSTQTKHPNCSTTCPLSNLWPTQTTTGSMKRSSAAVGWLHLQPHPGVNSIRRRTTFV